MTTDPAGTDHAADLSVTVEDVRAAADRLAGARARGLLRTPLVRWPADPPGGRPLDLKPESLQPTGAFKLRGAYNAVAALAADRRGAGVVTHSSGNHGRALAWAARAFGVPCAVVCPENAPAVKVEGMRAFGAEVLLVPFAERSGAADELAAARGAALIPPYDHPDVIAGQGTVGLELAEDLAPDATVLVPIGGGGLISGVALTLAALRPDVTVAGVEPELAGDTAASVAAGHRVEWSLDDTSRTVADGLRAAVVGELTWTYVRRYVRQVLTVAEADVEASVGELARTARLVAEPSGAVAPAAALHRPASVPGEGPVAAVVSGGNVDPALLARVL